MSLLGLKGMAIAGALSAVVGFGSGVWVRDAFCDAAAAKLEAQRLQQERDHALGQVRRHEANTKDVLKRVEQASERETELNEKVKEYERELAKRPTAPECRLNDDDLKWLRNLKPTVKPSAARSARGLRRARKKGGVAETPQGR